MLNKLIFLYSCKKRVTKPNFFIFYFWYVQRFFRQEPNSTRIFGNSQKIDLTLKLSLGGHGVQNSNENFLARSSSIGGKISQKGAVNGAYADSSVVLPLERSCSLPVGAEKGLMRFGDLQTMRRAETGKRLLLEKQRRLALAAAEKEKSTSPSEMFALKAVSVSKSPALSRAIDILKGLKSASGDSKHEGNFLFSIYALYLYLYIALFKLEVNSFIVS